MPCLPDEYFEEESECGRFEEDVFPRNLLIIVLKNLRVFGHFDNKIFVDLMKNIDYLNLTAHDSLFKVKKAAKTIMILNSNCVFWRV